MEIFFDPKTGQFTTKLEGKASMSSEDLVQILDEISDSLKESGCKTVGEYFNR